MALINYIDGENRRIYLSSSTTSGDIHPIEIYKEVRALRRLDESLRQFPAFLRGEGNVDKGGGKATERYVVLLEGCRIVPFDVTHSLTVTGTLITDDGKEGIEAFDRLPLTATTLVDINYIPPQVEVVRVTTGSGLDSQQEVFLSEVHAAHFNKRIRTDSEIVLYSADGVTPLATFDTDSNATFITPR